MNNLSKLIVEIARNRLKIAEHNKWDNNTVDLVGSEKAHKVLKNLGFIFKSELKNLIYRITNDALEKGLSLTGIEIERKDGGIEIVGLDKELNTLAKIGSLDLDPIKLVYEIDNGETNEFVMNLIEENDNNDYIGVGEEYFNNKHEKVIKDIIEQDIPF